MYQGTVLSCTLCTFAAKEASWVRSSRMMRSMYRCEGAPPRGCVQHVQERQQQHLQITARLQPSLRPQVLLRSSCVSISAPMHRVNTCAQYLSCCHDTE